MGSLGGAEPLLVGAEMAEEERMTLSLKQRDEVWRRLSTRVMPRLTAIREMVENGEAADYDHDVWEACLDWVEGPLAKALLYDPRLPPDQRGEKSPLYSKFEVFNRGRIQGVLENPKFVGGWFLLLRYLMELEEDGLKFFGVKFRDDAITGEPEEEWQRVKVGPDAP